MVPEKTVQNHSSYFFVQTGHNSWISNPHCTSGSTKILVHELLGSYSLTKTMQTNGRRGNCLRGFDLKNCLRGTPISTALWLFSQDNRIRVLQNTMKPVNTDPGEGEGAYEQVLEVGRGDIFLGLVRGEEAQLADHLVAAPQQVDTLPDPFLPSTTTNTPMISSRPINRD
jgi:hypothetical protein